MKNEFSLAFNEVLEDKQLPPEIIMEAIEAAMVSAYRRAVNASNAQHIEARLDRETGRVTVYAEKEVVDSVQDPRTEVTLREAQRVEPEAEIGDMVVVESTPRNFGRVAAQTARQVIQQRLREAERQAQLEHFKDQVGEILSGVVQAVNPAQVTLGLDMKAEGVMPRSQQIPGERFRVHDRVRALLLEVKESTRGPAIILSRAHRNFLRRLLENEVPEIYHGMVEVRSIAREPGQRSKVAVSALQPGVDPVGACVGIRGVRIQAIVRELNDEKIDVIEWSPDQAVYIAKALSPARVSGVYLNDQVRGTKTATVVVPEDQLSLAIGRDGQNARLAAKLTSWRIDIKSLPEAATESLYKIQNNERFAAIAEEVADIINQVELTLGKKAEGRPVTPEEYQVLNQFVERVERGAMNLRDAEKKAEEDRKRRVQAKIPVAAFDIPLEDFQVSDRVYAVISEAGYPTIGDLMLTMKTDPDSILALKGMGPKGMAELEEALNLVENVLREAEAAEAAMEAAEAEPEVLQEVEESTPVSEAVPPAEAEVLVPEEEPEVEEEPVAEVEEAEVELAVEAEEVEEVPAEEGVAPADAFAAEAALETQEGLAEEEEEESLDELFTLEPDSLFVEEFEDEEDEEEEEEEGPERGKKKKKRKKRRYVELEYDPEKDVMVARKKRKRGRSEDWDY